MNVTASNKSSSGPSRSSKGRGPRKKAAQGRKSPSKSRKATRGPAKGRGRGRSGPGREESDARPEIGAGPIGSMCRWARLKSRLGFVLALPPRQGSEDSISRLLKNVASMNRPGLVGVTRSDLEAWPAHEGRLTRSPFAVAELPTRDVRHLRNALNRRLSPGLLDAALAALVHGVPMLVTDPARFAELEVLTTLPLRRVRGDDEPGKRLRDFCRALEGGLVESYASAEKPMLTLLDLESGKARRATLKNTLKRHIDARSRRARRSADHASVKSLLRVAEEGETADVLILDLLPLILMRLEAEDFRRTVEALATPLGVLSLGLLPVLSLPARS